MSSSCTQHLIIFLQIVRCNRYNGEAELADYWGQPSPLNVASPGAELKQLGVMTTNQPGAAAVTVHCREPTPLYPAQYACDRCFLDLSPCFSHGNFWHDHSLSCSRNDARFSQNCGLVNDGDVLEDSCMFHEEDTRRLCVTELEIDASASLSAHHHRSLLPALYRVTRHAAPRNHCNGRVGDDSGWLRRFPYTPR